MWSNTNVKIIANDDGIGPLGHVTNTCAVGLRAVGSLTNLLVLRD